MECGQWNEKDWDDLIAPIQLGNCILMLGPDAAMEVCEGQARSLTEVLAYNLAGEILPEELKTWNIDPFNLVQVAQYYEIKLKKKPTLQMKAKRFYAERQDLTSDLHRDLAALPFALSIIATPDQMFSNALKEAGKTPVPQSYSFRGKKAYPSLLGTIKNPLLFYLYGTIEDPQSLVLSENDFLDFILAALVNNPLPPNILGQLRLASKNLLFLGFDFRQWALRILLRILDIKKDMYSFALDQLTLQNPEEFKRTILFYSESDYRIRICNQALPGFVNTLRAKYEEANAYDRPSAASPQIRLQDAPTVFLCHAKENRDRAADLRDRLQAAGFNAWFDEKNLRGGDEWDRTIKKAIAEEIDYFVVLQSQIMSAKLESYFHKEIKLALERQDKFKSGIRFIIPVQIEECPRIEELDHLHSIDLSQKEHIANLITTLERDQERRKRK